MHKRIPNNMYATSSKIPKHYSMTYSQTGGWTEIQTNRKKNNREVIPIYIYIYTNQLYRQHKKLKLLCQFSLFFLTFFIIKSYLSILIHFYFVVLSISLLRLARTVKIQETTQVSKKVSKQSVKICEWFVPQTFGRHKPIIQPISSFKLCKVYLRVPTCVWEEIWSQETDPSDLKEKELFQDISLKVLEKKKMQDQVRTERCQLKALFIDNFNVLKVNASFKQLLNHNLNQYCMNILNCWATYTEKIMLKQEKQKKFENGSSHITGTDCEEQLPCKYTILSTSALFYFHNSSTS